MVLKNLQNDSKKLNCLRIAWTPQCYCARGSSCSSGGSSSSFSSSGSIVVVVKVAIVVGGVDVYVVVAVVELTVVDKVFASRHF